jgi:hypothetical protein
VVIGNTADDFALAQGWNLLFGKSHWIPESNLPLEGPLKRVAWTLGHDLANDAVHWNKGAVLTSASMPLDQLQQLAHEWESERSMMINSLDDEATETSGEEPDVKVSCTPPDTLNWDHGGMLVIQEDYDIPLAVPAEKNDQGDINLLVDLPPLTPTDSTLRKAGLTWQIDLHFINATTPHTRGLSPRLLQADEHRYESLVRPSRHGLTCYSGSWGFVAAGSTQIQALAKPRLRLPGLYSWAQALAEDHDMKMAFSAAGHRVDILRRIWGSRAALALDWGGPLRPIFLAFRTQARKTTTAFPEGGGLVLAPNEAVLSFNGMMRTVGATSDVEIKKLRSDIDRLCLLGVLRRGLVLNCEACSHLGFIPVDTVSSVNSCVRCGAQNPLTVDRWRGPIEEPTWWYDLHGAARELLATDSGIGLLSSAHLQKSARAYADLSELEFFRHDKKAVAEIDLLASCDDKVIVGEAKSHPNLGNKTERNSKAEKLAMVARALKADEILLCTSATGDWSPTDLGTVRTAIAERFTDAPDQPTIRVITGLGTTEVIDLTL